jgi:hypothetical protein
LANTSALALVKNGLLINRSPAAVATSVTPGRLVEVDDDDDGEVKPDLANGLLEANAEKAWLLSSALEDDDDEDDDDDDADA